MKNTLRILSAVMVLASASAAKVQAQGGGGGGGGGQQMTPEQRLQRTKDMLFKDITLTPAQVAKADTILMAASAKQREAMQAAQAGGGDMTAAREAMTKLNADRNASLKAILTTDADKAKFDANLAAMPQGRGRGGR
jgi:Spy/CpxP family protein refolding chaperone